MISRMLGAARLSSDTYEIEAVEAYATLGEISDVFRSVFGEQQEFAPF